MENPIAQSNDGDRPTAEDVSKVVAAIVESGVLGKSTRRARLLRYLVEQELAGKGETIKAFTIATDVLGRGASFEASTDSIVRSEVGRLRDALTLFFAQNGDEDFYTIDIPKGSYRPTFTAPVARQTNRGGIPGVSVFLGVGVVAVVAALVIWMMSSRKEAQIAAPVSISDLPFEVIRISVDPFEGRGENPAVEDLAFGIYSELVMDLSVYPWISVISSLVDPPASDVQHADYVLTGSTSWMEDALTTHAELVALPAADVIWSTNMTVPATPETITQSVVEVSSQIAAVLGSIHGIAPQLAKARSAQVSSEGLDALLCFLGLYTYLERPTDAAHQELRDCLSDTLERFPSYGDAWAALAIVQMDESRFERNPRMDADPWTDAAQSVQQALIYAPTRMPSLNAAVMHAIEGPVKNREDFERYADLLLNLYPRHPPTLFTVGSRMAEFAGEWENGLDLVDQALALEPNPPSFFHITRAYNQVLLGSDKDAWFAAQKLTAQTSKSELLLKFLAASRNGFQEDMESSLKSLSDEGLSGKEDIVAHVRGRRYASELEAALLEQLDAAFSEEEMGE